MNVPHDALFQNCENGFAQLNTGAFRAPDKNYFKLHPPEPMAQIRNNFKELLRYIFKGHLLNHWYKLKNNFTESFLLIPSIESAQIVLLR